VVHDDEEEEEEGEGEGEKESGKELQTVDRTE